MPVIPITYLSWSYSGFSFLTGLSSLNFCQATTVQTFLYINYPIVFELNFKSEKNFTEGRSSLNLRKKASIQQTLFPDEK